MSGLSWQEAGDLLKVTIEDTGGPQQQEVFVNKFIPNFKMFADVDRDLYYPHFFTWMGETRELSAVPVLDQINQAVSSGKYGLVTNSARLDVVGTRMGEDNIMQVRLWAGRPVQSTVELFFDWTSWEKDRPVERIAVGHQKTTWVEILGHGLVKPEPLPAFYADFLARMSPRNDAPDSLPPMPEPWRDLDLGPPLFRAKNGPRAMVPLASKLFETSQFESNLVANIYFSNYAIWLARLRESYFFPLVPEAYRSSGRRGVLKCLNCSVHHLREGMPFDAIEATMALKAVHERGLELAFEFYRRDASGETIKLAYGDQRAVWLVRDADGRAVPAPLPAAITGPLLAAAGDRMVA